MTARAQGNCTDPHAGSAGTSFAPFPAHMSFVQSFQSFGFAQPVSPPQAQVWDCFNRGQVLAAAFEVHEAAMKAGFMPDEATTLSLTLAELCSQSVTYARGGVATVFFSDGGFRLEIADSGPSGERLPVLHSKLPRALTSLRARAAGTGTVVIAEYERFDDA